MNGKQPKFDAKGNRRRDMGMDRNRGGCEGRDKTAFEGGGGINSWKSQLRELCHEKIGIRTGPFGSQLHAAEYSQKGVPVVMPKDLYNGRVNSRDATKIPPEVARRLSQHRCKAGDILFARRGEVGRCGLVTDDAAGCICGTGCIRIRISPENDPRFVALSVGTRSAYHWLQCNAVGQTMLNLNAEILGRLPLYAPPLEEQQNIAAIFDVWDRAIETLESLISAKSDRKRSLLQQLLTGRKRLPGFRGKWPVKKLGDLAQNSAATNRGKHGWDRLYGVTKAEGMTPMREHVRGASNDRCKLVKPGWFAYNPMRLNIGSLARWQGDNEVMVSGDYVVFRCLEGKLDPRYFDHLRRSHAWTLFVNKSGSGSVRVRLYFKDIARFKIPCPPIEEQTAIADLLDTCDRELALHRQQLEAIREQKRGLMQKLLTGEVRVKP